MRAVSQTFGDSVDKIGNGLFIGIDTGPRKACRSPTQVDPQAQRPLDRHLPVAEGGVGEDLRLLGLLEVEEGVADALDVLVGELAVLLAQVLAQRLEPLRGVDELHLARRCSGLRLVSTQM